MNPNTWKAAHPMVMLVTGMTTVVILAWQRLIVDGETVAALSAVLSGAMGARALDRPNGGGGPPDA